MSRGQSTHVLQFNFTSGSWCTATKIETTIFECHWNERQSKKKNQKKNKRKKKTNHGTFAGLLLEFVLLRRETVGRLDAREERHVAIAHATVCRIHAHT